MGMHLKGNKRGVEWTLSSSEWGYIWEWAYEHADDIIPEGVFEAGFYNEGAGLTAEQSIALRRRLIRERNIVIESANFDAREALPEPRRLPYSDEYDLPEGLDQFVDFLRKCDGFIIN